MATPIDYSYYAYDRINVKNAYAKKLETNVAKAYSPEADVVEGYPSDTFTRTPVSDGGYFFNSLCADYMEGAITEEEFFNYLTDMYYAKFSAWHIPASEIPLEEKQKMFDTIIAEADNGIMYYYMMQNKSEWGAVAPDSTFFYNAEYHYQHQEAQGKFLEQAKILANELGLSDKYVENMGEDVLRTFHAQMSTMMAFSRSGANKFVNLDILPPRDFKMALKTKYSPYEVKIWCGNQTFCTNIPFSWNDLTHTVSLSDLMADFDIPPKYLAFVNNVLLIHRDIAWSDKNRPHDIFAFNPKIVEAVKAYDNTTAYLY